MVTVTNITPAFIGNTTNGTPPIEVRYIVNGQPPTPGAPSPITIFWIRSVAPARTSAGG